MINICNGLKANQLTQFDTDPFDYIWNYEPVTIDIHDFNKREYFKKNQAQYFIAGETLQGKRGNEYLLNKELLSFDYEGLDISLKEFISKVEHELEGLSFILYPTIHCFNKQLANGEVDKRFRYRLVINLDREYTEEENDKLIKTVGHLIGIDYDPKSKTYSQLMGLPILTPYTLPNMIIKRRGKNLSVDEILALKIPQESAMPSFKFSFSEKKYTASFMEELMEGVSEGNRNNWLTQQVGRLLYLGMEHDIAYQWLWLINENFVSPPLKDKEINTIFRSILNKELKKAR